MSGTGSGTGGRPKSSSVWKYFTYDKESDKSVCIVNTQIEDSQDSLNTVSVCGKEFKGQFPTNLKRHLKNCHYEQYKCFVLAEKERSK